MDIETYELGQLVRLTASFTNAADRNFDPTDVYVVITDPDGGVSTLHFGADLAVNKDAVGQYHVDQIAEKVGVYEFRWYSTGSGRAARKGRFIIER